MWMLPDNYADHSPPHFHAIYGFDETVVDIRSTKLLAGGVPKRALSLVRTWARLHRDELLANWDLGICLGKPSS